MEESSGNSTLLFRNVPIEASIAELDQEIFKHTSRKTAVKAISWKTSHLAHCKNATVVFYNKNDAKKLLQMNQISIGQEEQNQQITITIFRSKVEQHKKTTGFDQQICTSSLESFKFAIDKNVIEFVRQCKKVTKLLEDSFTDFAYFHHSFESGKCWLNFAPNLTKTALATQEDFERECTKKLQTCLCGIKSEVFQYNANALRTYQKEHGYADTAFHENPPCLIKWELDKDLGQIIVSGMGKQVDLQMNKFREEFLLHSNRSNYEQNSSLKSGQKSKQKLDTTFEENKFSYLSATSKSCDDISTTSVIDSNSNTYPVLSRSQSATSCSTNSSVTSPTISSAEKFLSSRSASFSSEVPKRASSVKTTKKSLSATTAASAHDDSLQPAIRSSSISSASPKLAPNFKRAANIGRRNFAENIHKKWCWSELLEEDRSLFTDFDKKCIVISKIPAECSCDEITSFLEKENISGGSKVNRIFRVRDGFLVAFDDKKAVTNILAHEEISFQGKSLIVSRKSIPQPNDRMFLVEKQKKDKSTLSKEYVKVFLESIVELKTSTSCFTNARFPNKVLVLSQTPVDFNALQNGPFKHLKVTQLCDSDLIHLADIDSIITETDIRNVFGANNCEVTHIFRKEKKAIVCLADYKNITKLLRETLLTIGDMQLSMEYFVAGFGVLTKDQYQKWQKSETKENVPSTSCGKPQLSSFFHQFDVKRKIAKYFHVFCSSLIAMTNSNLMGIAEVTSILPLRHDHQFQLQISFEPLTESKKTFSNQEQFKEKCCKKMQNILKDYVTKEVRASHSAADKILEKVSSQEDNFLVIDQDDMQLAITWNDESYWVLLNITGKQKKVECLINRIEQVIKPLPCSLTVFMVLKRCGIIYDVEKNFPVEIAQIAAEDEKKAVYFWSIKGTSSNVEQAQKLLREKLQGLREIRNFELSPVKNKFLTDSLKNPKSTVEEKINSLFQENHLKSFLQLTEMTLYSKEESHTECLKVLQKMIEEFEFPITIKSTKKWNDVISFVKTSKCLTLTEQENVLCLVGLSPEVFEAKEKIALALGELDWNLGAKTTDQNESHYHCTSAEKINNLNEKIEVVEMSQFESQYIQTFYYAIGLQTLLKKVDLDNDKNGIKLVGKSEDVRETVATMKKVLSNLTCTPYVIQKKWQIKFLLSEFGEQFLKNLQKEQVCVIVEKDFEEGDLLKTSSKNPSTASTSIPCFPQQPRNLPQVQLPNTNVIIRLVKGDITAHHVDAIVNTSNQKLELKSAGVSGCILQKGGYSIQQEMTACLNKLPYQILQTGEAVTTNAGRLPCKTIIHVAGPVWDEIDDQSAVIFLQKSVKSCLKEADEHKLSSIAIPAISCGVFGGDPDLSSQLIVQSIVDFFTSNKHTSLEQVDLIELNNEALMYFMAKYLNELAEKLQTSLAVAHPQKAGTTASLHQIYSSQKQAASSARNGTSSFVSVKCMNMDILSAEANVILIPVGHQFDLKEFEISKNVEKAVGKDVCKKWSKSKNWIVEDPYFKITCSSANLPCEFVVHLIITRTSRNRLDCQTISSNLTKVFQAVENKLSIQSIAIPAIGTGRAGLSAFESGKMIETALQKFEKNNPKNLKTITVVTLNHCVVAEFIKLFPTWRFQLQSASSKSPTSKSLSHLSTTSRSFHISNDKSKVHCQLKNKTLKLTLCAADQTIIQKTITKIEKKLANESDERRIKNVPSYFTEKLLPEDVKQNKYVKIELTSNVIVVSGLNEDVKEVSKKIKKCLSSIK